MSPIEHENIAVIQPEAASGTLHESRGSSRLKNRQARAVGLLAWAHSRMSDHDQRWRAGRGYRTHLAHRARIQCSK